MSSNKDKTQKLDSVHRLKNGNPAKKPKPRQSNRKKAGLMSESVLLGQLRAKAKFAKTKLGIHQDLNEILIGAVKKIKPVETLAILGTTMLLHNYVIDPAYKLLKPAVQTVRGGNVIQGAVQAALSPFQHLTVFGGLGYIPTQTTEGLKILPLEKINSEHDLTTQEKLMIWVLSFAIAYILINHAGEIIMALGQAAGSMPQVLGFFFAAGAA